jgi:hypothetical protein
LPGQPAQPTASPQDESNEQLQQLWQTLIKERNSQPATEQPSLLPPEGRLWVPDRCLIVLERVG